MDLFSKKPLSQDNDTNQSVSNDTTQPERTQTIAQPSTTPVVHKEKHSRAFSFVSVLFLLMLLVAGIMTYLWYNQAADVDSLKSELSQAKSEQDVLRKQVADLKKDEPLAPGTEAVTKSDDDLIKEATGAYKHAQKFGANTKLTFSGIQKNLPFAKVSVAVEGSGGYACWLKKSDNVWVVMFCGQQLPEQEDLDTWGMPAGILQ